MKWKRMGRCVLLLILLLGMSACAGNEAGPGIQMNGEAVSEEEFLQAMNAEKFYVERYFADRFQADIAAEGFWEQEQGGELPWKKLLEQTIASILSRRAMYEVAEERGYIQEAGYEAMKERLEAENRQRADKLARGEVVYGLTSFSMEQWMDYEEGILAETFCYDMDNPEMQLTEEEKQTFFEEGLEAGTWVDLDGVDGITMEEMGVGLDQELRKVKYQELLAERAANIEVTMEETGVYRFMIRNLKK